METPPTPADAGVAIPPVPTSFARIRFSLDSEASSQFTHQLHHLTGIFADKIFLIMKAARNAELATVGFRRCAPMRTAARERVDMQSPLHAAWESLAATRFDGTSMGHPAHGETDHLLDTTGRSGMYVAHAFRDQVDRAYAPSARQ